MYVFVYLGVFLCVCLPACVTDHLNFKLTQNILISTFYTFYSIRNVAKLCFDKYVKGVMN